MKSNYDRLMGLNITDCIPICEALKIPSGGWSGDWSSGAVAKESLFMWVYACAKTEKGREKQIIEILNG